MARRIEHRSRYGWDVHAVYAALVDPDYLADRLAVLGGQGAELVEHEAGPDGAEYRVKHGVAAKDLPGVVRSLLGGDLTIDRRETWRPDGAGRYTGTILVTIPGMPGELTGEHRLTAVEAGDTERVIIGTVKVPIPLVGGKVEESVGGQIRQLLDAEHAFTEEWLGKHRQTG